LLKPEKKTPKKVYSIPPLEEVVLMGNTLFLFLKKSKNLKNFAPLNTSKEQFFYI